MIESLLHQEAQASTNLDGQTIVIPNLDFKVGPVIGDTNESNE